MTTGYVQRFKGKIKADRIDLVGNGVGMMGGGSSASRAALGTTAGNMLGFYTDAKHTTGDMRTEYINMTFSGAGGSGEALRAYSQINGVSVATGGTVNGAHISMGTIGAGAKVSGSANALRATFGIAAATTALGGTCAVLALDSDIDTAAALPPNMAFISIVNLNTTKVNALLRMPTVVAETAGLFCAHTTASFSHSIRIVDAAGTPYYIMCTNSASNRTVS